MSAKPDFSIAVMGSVDCGKTTIAKSRIVTKTAEQQQDSASPQPAATKKTYHRAFTLRPGTNQDVSQNISKKEVYRLPLIIFQGIEKNKKALQTCH